MLSQAPASYSMHMLLLWSLWLLSISTVFSDHAHSFKCGVEQKGIDYIANWNEVFHDVNITMCQEKCKALGLQGCAGVVWEPETDEYTHSCWIMEAMPDEHREEDDAYTSVVMCHDPHSHPPPECGSEQIGIDYPGGNIIGSNKLGVHSVDECKHICEITDGCHGFSWYREGLCALKEHLDADSRRANHVAISMSLCHHR